MKSLKFGKAAGIMAAVMVMGLALTGCQKSTTSIPANDAAAATDTVVDAAVDTAVDTVANVDLSGSITMAGSTSMEKLSNAAAEAFMNKFPETTVSAEFTGSGAGVEAVLAGTVNIGNASRELKDSEKELGAVENIIAIDGIAVILDKANTAADLTKAQLRAIYEGTIRNWSEVGGVDQPIVVVGREAGSGTRGAFEELLELADKCAYSNELDNTGAVMAKVASTQGAIGYVSLDVVDDTVITAKLEGVEATSDNIIAGNYFLSRPFVMATNGEIAAQDEIVQEFFDFLKSEEGTTLIKAVGLIPVQ